MVEPAVNLVPGSLLGLFTREWEEGWVFVFLAEAEHFWKDPGRKPVIQP